MSWFVATGHLTDAERLKYALHLGSNTDLAKIPIPNQVSFAVAASFNSDSEQATPIYGDRVGRDVASESVKLPDLERFRRQSGSDDFVSGSHCPRNEQPSLHPLCTRHEFGFNGKLFYQCLLAVITCAWSSKFCSYVTITHV